MTQDPGRHLGGEPQDPQTQAVGHTDAPTQAIDGLDEQASVTRHEEQAHISTELQESGRVKVRKHVESYPVEEVVPRNVEHADTERIGAVEGDSGEVETLEDGSISIPIFEEVLVVTKRLVVRERVIVRKRTVIDEYTLQTELQREHVSVEGDIEVPTTGTTGTTGTGDRTDLTDDRPASDRT